MITLMSNTIFINTITVLYWWSIWNLLDELIINYNINNKTKIYIYTMSIIIITLAVFILDIKLL